MSYCVNCGVELDVSAKKCALCATRVINPKIKKIEEEKTPFAKAEHVPQSVQKQFVSYIISIVMLIPTIICVLCNILIFKSSLWSLGVGSTMFLLWVVFVFPFFTSKLKPYLMWAFDSIAIPAYIYSIFVVGGFETGVFLKIILPYFVIGSICVLIYMIWSKAKPRHWLLRFMFIFSFLGIIMFLGGLNAFLFGSGHILLSLGIISIASSSALVGFLVYCYSSKRMRKWISEKFFI
ncbi:MAG: hypothetical protein R3Y27_00770 [Clostridia bacterium]